MAHYKLMIALDVLSFLCTIVVLLLLVLQLVSKKGDFLHVGRGILLGVLSVFVVALNFLALKVKGTPLTWDMPFIVHTVLGGLFFGSIIITGILGWLLKKGKVRKIWHRISAIVTGMLLLSVIVLSFAIHYVR